MKPTPPEQFRLSREAAKRLNIPEHMGTSPDFGRNGVFMVPCAGELLRCVISDGMEWEHVSVSLNRRCPTWAEMCFIKDTFFEPEECVIQYHPPHSEYVNCHPYCLHLWKPVNQTVPRPKSVLVGPKSS